METKQKKVVIVGGGGHAKIVIDILQENNKFELVGYTSHPIATDNIFGVPCVGDDSILPTLQEKGVENFCIALGNNRMRKTLYDHMIRMGFAPIDVISPHAHISPRVTLGKGIVVCHGAVINADALVGDNVIINTLAGIDHDCVIHSHSHIAPNVALAGCVEVEEGSFIGIGSSVLPNIKIGSWSTVGAGATVLNNIPASVTVAGVPAKIIKKG